LLKIQKFPHRNYNMGPGYLQENRKRTKKPISFRENLSVSVPVNPGFYTLRILLSVLIIALVLLILLVLLVLLVFIVLLILLIALVLVIIHEIHLLNGNMRIVYLFRGMLIHGDTIVQNRTRRKSICFSSKTDLFIPWSVSIP